MKPSLSFVRGAAIGSILSLAVLVAIPVLADRGDGWARGPHFNPGHNQEILEAFKNDDYEAWKTLIEESGRHAKMLDFVTEENFSTFAEMHALKKEGNYEEAKALAEELGIDFKNKKGGHRGFGHKFGGGMWKGQHGDYTFLLDLSEEDHGALHDAMMICKSESDDWKAIKQCRKDIMSEYRDE